MRFRAFIFEIEEVLVDASRFQAAQEALSIELRRTDLSLEHLQEGAEELLLQLKRQQVEIAVVSVARHSSLTLNRLGISSYTDHVLSFDEHQSSESSGNAFVDAAAQLQLDTGRCVGVVGSETGLANVKAAGMYAVGIGSPDIIGAADSTYAHLRDIMINDL